MEAGASLYSLGGAAFVWRVLILRLFGQMSGRFPFLRFSWYRYP
jgi:hypothetical protein